MRTPTTTPAHARMVVARFNEDYPVGTPCRLRKDSGVVDTKVRGAAFLFLDKTPVAFFEGVSGAYSIDGRVSAARPQSGERT